ncbi:MAG: DsbA family oxidoreductase [Steroidobacter sp.]
MRIDFISDIACPWCAVGVASLDKALQEAGSDFEYELHFQPFELNPGMPKEGRNLVEYLSQKYGMSADRIKASHDMLYQRGKEVGFEFGRRDHIWNTFDAHRLLYWADQLDKSGAQFALKKALLRAYHGEAKNPSDRDVLLQAVAAVNLDTQEAQRILSSDLYAAEVHQLEHQWQRSGINAVPSMVINQRHLLQGAQPVETIVQALQQLANSQ